MGVFDREVAALRASLDNALVGMEDSIAKFSDSVLLAGGCPASIGSGAATFGCESIPRPAMGPSGLRPRLQQPLGSGPLVTEPIPYEDI